MRRGAGATLSKKKKTTVTILFLNCRPTKSMVILVYLQHLFSSNKHRPNTYIGCYLCCLVYIVKSLKHGPIFQRGCPHITDLPKREGGTWGGGGGVQWIGWVVRVGAEG